MKKTILVLMILPCLLMIVVNESQRPIRHDYEQERCSRYCHDRECPHFALAIQEHSISAALHSYYQWNISWLKQNGLGLTYREMNILVYLLVYPTLISLLLWGLIRPRHGKNN